MIEFATFIGAVKPRGRTDQYFVLAGLFCLGGHATPVTARELGDLLKLHLRAQAPANLSDTLRKNPKYVTPREKGPPLKWALTPAGLDHLRNLSGLSVATTKDSTAFGADVAIICALEHPEFSAVTRAFGGERAWKEVGDGRLAHMYRQTEIATSTGEKLRVVGTTSTSMGLTAAAIATTQLLMSYKPRLVLMVGIAAGTRSGDKCFGDVLVADPSVDYNSGKVVLQDGIREFLPDPYPIGLNARLRSVLQRYRNRPEVFAKIRADWTGRLPAGETHLHLGPLGAADQVIDDASRVLEIQKNWRKLIGVEMETYAVYRACHESPEPKPRFASFKAVCDFAAEKTDSWQDYAAFVAAKFAYHFVTSDWAALWPSE